MGFWFSSVGLKSVNSCGVSLERKGSVVKSWTGSRGARKKKEKVSRRSPLHPSDWCMCGGMKGERGVGEVEEQD